MGAPGVEKQILIELTRSCFIEGVEHFAGSVVRCKERNAKYVIALGKAKVTDAKEPKEAPRAKKANESSKAEKK